MIRIKAILCLLILLSIGTLSTQAQDLYNQNVIQKIEINFTESNWDNLMDIEKAGSEGYLMANWVKVNGVLFDSVGVKYKGNSSYSASRVKNPLHIELDGYVNQNYNGFTDIKLGNGFSDPSNIREVLAYDLLRNYMHAPRANFAQVIINGSYIGLFSNPEAINKKFCGDHFYSSQNPLVKCNPQNVDGSAMGNKPNLKYISADSSAYDNYYEVKSNYGWNALRDLCNTVTNDASNLSREMDVDRAIWMLAFNDATVNLDSYTGAFAQNYYEYRDNTNHFNSIVWDLNMSFGGFPMLSGGGGGGGGSLSITQMQQLTPLANNSTNWPLIYDILNNSTYKRMYLAHLKTFVTEMLASGVYASKASAMMATIDTAVLSDLNKFYSYTQFQNSLTTSVTGGGGPGFTTPGISQLIDARVTYLNGTTEFTNTQPTITAITPSSSSPAYNSSVTINANVINTNTNGVYLGYRGDITQKFTRILMYDDGAHGDGASGDDVYGASITVLSGATQYYIYAENNNAGMFSPQRAEHEFYTLNASAVAAAAGNVAINEILSKNDNKEKDEYNEREDWIELYNPSTVLVDLSNAYLGDALTTLKWKFPVGTYINPNDYLMIWSDDDSMQTILHTNFGLSSSADKVILSSSAGMVIDSVSFFNQSADISYGRYPNGSGFFQVMPTSYKAENNLTSIEPIAISTETILVYPNPSTQYISFDLNENVDIKSIMVSNMMGQVVFDQADYDDLSLDISSFANGVYILKMKSTLGNQYTARFIKQ